MATRILFVATLVCVACSSQESVEEHNKKLAAKLDRDRGSSKAIKIETAVPGGTKIPCDKLIDAALLTEKLEEKDPVTVADQTKQEADATSVCSVRRGGEVMSAKKQEELAKKTMKLGVIAGDELCSIAAFCSVPANEEQQRKKCEDGNMDSNETIGVFACVKVTPKGPTDAYTYTFVDPDSRCVLRVRGGPSVDEESDVQRCAKAALELIGPASLP